MIYWKHWMLLCRKQCDSTPTTAAIPTAVWYQSDNETICAAVWYHSDKPSLHQCDITPTMKTIHAAVWYCSDNSTHLCSSVISLWQWHQSLHQCDITPKMTPIFAAACYHLDIESHPCRSVISVPSVGVYNSDIQTFYILHTVVPANIGHACYMRK